MRKLTTCSLQIISETIHKATSTEAYQLSHFCFGEQSSITRFLFNNYTSREVHLWPLSCIYKNIEKAAYYSKQALPRLLHNL